MKKYIIFMSVCLSLIGIGFATIDSQNESLNYKIYMDSSTINSYDKKMEIFEVLDMLCEFVDEDSYYVLVKDNLHLFEAIEDCKVKFKGSTLSVYFGNGKGSYIDGTYTYSDTCFSEEVEVESSFFDFLFK